jgi:hypothetical protein
MTYDGFCKQLIDEGIAAARADYTNDRPDMLAGSLEGFEACRGKQPHEISDLLAIARQESQIAMQTAYEDDVSGARYQHLSCKQAEIEWVANVISAALEPAGEPPIVIVTARGLMKAASILNGAALLYNIGWFSTKHEF